jgi:hypothetical protein
MANLQKELEVAEGRLARLKSDQPKVRSRLKKIVEEEDQIAIIKAKMDNLTQTQTSKQTPAAQAILNSLGDGFDGAFGSVEVKREVVKTLVPLTGPGSQYMPLDIDEEVPTQGPFCSPKPQSCYSAVNSRTSLDGHTMPDGQSLGLESTTMGQPIPHGQDLVQHGGHGGKKDRLMA